MRKKIVVFILFIFGIFFCASTSVSARDTIDFYTSFYPGEGEIGSIVIYDDYVVRVGYKYSASDVEIRICPLSSCSNLNTQIYNSSETYFDGDYTDFYLADHFTLTNSVEYKILVTSSFKPTASAINDTSTGFIETDFEYIEEKASSEDGGKSDNDKYAKEALTRTEKIILVFKIVIIPLIYALLIVVLVVKGVLLGIDISKHADEPEVRKEKIRAFVYFGIALFFVAILNTVGGFVTGLFG